METELDIYIIEYIWHNCNFAACFNNLLGPQTLCVYVYYGGSLVPKCEVNISLYLAISHQLLRHCHTGNNTNNRYYNNTNALKEKNIL